MKDTETLASEMLREIKATSRRWFIAFIIVVILWVTTIAGFLFYISQFEVVSDESDMYISTSNNGDDNDGSIDIQGDVVNGNN